MDKKVCYVYGLWFNPANSKDWGDINFGFTKEASVFYDDGTGKYVSDNWCSDYCIYDDGSNGFIFSINDDEEYASISKVSFDPNYMETFKIDSVRYLLNELWERYVRGNNGNEQKENG